MTDLVLNWQSDRASGDLVRDGARLATDEGLQSAVIISLFSDRRAEADDDLPQAGSDPRGWWADALAGIEGDQIGSRLWLLSREKQLPTALVKAKHYVEEATAWLVEDGVASKVDVAVELVRDGVLGFIVTIYRPEGPARFRFDYVWKNA